MENKETYSPRTQKTVNEMVAYMNMRHELNNKEETDQEELSEVELAEQKLAEAITKARKAFYDRNNEENNSRASLNDLIKFNSLDRRQKISDVIIEPENNCNICGSRWHTHDVCPYSYIEVALPTDNGSTIIYRVLFSIKLIVQLMYDGENFRHWECYDQTINKSHTEFEIWEAVIRRIGILKSIEKIPSSTNIREKSKTINISNKKFGKNYGYPEETRLQAVIDYYSIKKTHGITLEDFLDLRFGSEAGIPCVKRETFYYWKKQFKIAGKIDY